MRDEKKGYAFTKKDYDFMKSISAAILERSPKKLRIVLLFWLVSCTLFFLWAALSPIEEIVRGEGKVIPGGENQMIQHLEGGILNEIAVHEGQRVKEGDVLLKISNQKNSSTLDSSQFKVAELRAKVVRLKAESTNGAFSPTQEDNEQIPMQISQERNLYLANKDRLESALNALKDQVLQKQSELAEAQSRIGEQKRSLSLIREEIAMSEPMVAQGIKSRVEFLKLQREASDITERYNSLMASLPRLKAAINEISNKIQEVRYEFVSKARTDLNQAETELKRMGAENTALSDQVARTIIKSPLHGVVQKLYVNTIGGVIKPGDNLIEIVPTEGGLVIEAKIKPADIAFIYPGQRAVVKVTAYDFSLYGALEGSVTMISPDTTIDKKENVFYNVRIQTSKKFLGSPQKPLKIMPGMVVNVDIVTGKKTILEYILKPILKAHQYTFTER